MKSCYVWAGVMWAVAAMLLPLPARAYDNLFLDEIPNYPVTALAPATSATTTIALAAASAPVTSGADMQSQVVAQNQMVGGTVYAGLAPAAGNNSPAAGNNSPAAGEATSTAGSTTTIATAAENTVATSAPTATAPTTTTPTSAAPAVALPSLKTLLPKPATLPAELGSTAAPAAPATSTIPAAPVSPAAPVATTPAPTQPTVADSVTKPAATSDATAAVEAKDTPAAPAKAVAKKAAAPAAVKRSPGPKIVKKKEHVPAPAVAEREDRLTVPLLDDIPAIGALSRETKAILDKLPARLVRPEKVAAKPSSPVELDRAATASDVFGDRNYSKTEDVGVSIEVKKQDFSVGYALEQAYNSLVAGQREEAIQSYQRVLVAQPRNTTALLGLATTYHRSGQLAQARALYGQLLAIEPRNAQALNNFFALVAEESPSEALQQLAVLEAKNPGFSPIPAQMAVVYQRIGQQDKAAEKMAQALALSPENLSYRYNLAIIMDHLGRAVEASTLYRQLIQAHDQGERIPGSVQAIQERLTFLGSNKSLN